MSDETKFYRVKVRVEGVLRVQAPSPEDAAEIARKATPTMQGKPMFGIKVETETLGEVENHTLQPRNVRQRVKLGEAH